MPSTQNTADALLGRTRSAILGLLYGQPDESFYFQQIRRALSTGGVGAVQRDIQKLVDIGLIERSELGNQVFYKANRNHPLFTEIHSLITKTVGVFAVLRDALASIASGIMVAFVYGSVARGEATASSDVDLMVVGTAKFEEVVDRVAEAEKRLSRPVNPTLYTVQEFKAKLEAGNHFLNAVVNGPKVFLIGDEDELRAIRAERVVGGRGHQRR
jgi:predicted nucleotidyltransferase